MSLILVVDDEELVRKTIVQTLAKLDHEIIAVENGLEAVKYCQDNEPDLMITDIIMPDMEGIELIMKLHEKSPQMKIIAISGGGRISNFDFLEIAEKMGADVILHKPFLPSELRESVQNLLKSLTPA